MPWITSRKSFVEPVDAAAGLYRRALKAEAKGEDPLPFFEKAARQGHKKSILRTAQLCLERLDVNASVQWYKLSDDPEAMNSLGILHLNGIGVERSDSVAFKYFEKAALLDNYDAQYSLAELYYRGQGVAKNYALALKWFRESAAYLARAQLMMGNMLADGHGASEKDAIEWWREAAELGVEDAQHNLAISLLRAPGDHSESLRWLKRLAASNDSSALNSLGNMYYSGDTVLQNYDLAFEYYKKSAHLGNMNGQFNLAMSYGSGMGVAQDVDAAREWCLKAALKGLPEAETQMGVIYDSGIGTPVDRTKAFQWYMKAAVKGHAPAEFNVGLSYHHGIGVERNKEKALHWYHLASAGGVDFSESQSSTCSPPLSGTSRTRCSAP